jgi:hypothetical protein
MKRLACCLLFCCFAAPAGTIYTFTALQFIPTAINNEGQIVGMSLPSPGTSKPQVLFYGGGVAGQLLVAGATSMTVTGINDGGTVIGDATVNGVIHPYVATNGDAVDMFDQLGSSILTGINTQGQIVGDTNNGASFLYSQGLMTNLGKPNGGTEVTGINDKDMIVGSQMTGITAASQCGGTGGDRATIFGGSSTQNLGLPYGCASSTGVAVNNAGMVLGQSGSANDDRAFIYNTLKATTTILPTLGGSINNVYAMNMAGEVGGSSNLCTDPRQKCYNQYVATLYDNGVLYNLNSFLPADSGWVLTSAMGINDLGQIITEGYFNGKPAGMLLTLVDDPPAVPEPGSFSFLLVAGCCGLLAGRKGWPTNSAAD